MAINLRELQEAAVRFEEHKKAAEQADPKVVAVEKAKAAERHRKLFLPPVERLLAVQAAAIAAVPLEPQKKRRKKKSEEEDLLLVTLGGVLPEIIQRDNDLRPMRFLQIGLLAARSVGRIRLSDSPVTEEGDASGFIIAPGLLITNWHVLKTADFAAAGSVIFDDEDEINGEPRETKTFMLRPDRLFVNDVKLDYAIVEVASRTASGTPLAQFGYLPLFEQTGKLDQSQQRQAANIIQHPGGGRKKIAFRDNYITIIPDGVDPRKQLSSLFYGTDTLRGSSGSPVCSDQWYVVALHRGGVPKTKMINGQRVVLRLDGTRAQRTDPVDLIHYLTNEGTRVSRIYHSLRKKAKKEQAAAVALERIRAVAQDPRLGPINLPTSPILLPALPSQQEGGPEEITTRKIGKFENAKGYRPTFLGSNFRIPLPHMTSDVKRELAPLKNSTKVELKYDNYSVFMNRERRTAVFAAGNVNGKQLWNRPDGNGPLPGRPAWSYDPRVDESFQADDIIFSNSLQRGHLFKREDAIWGIDKPAMLHADEHSFTIPNATPMIRAFNNMEWGDLEDIVSDECKNKGNKVSYFAGPMFRSTDRFYNELRSNVPPDQLRQGMRVPETFWKIIAWVEDSKLKSAGFILTQKDEIAEHGPIEEINFGTYRKRPITEIEQGTGLRFPELREVDTFQT